MDTVVERHVERLEELRDELADKYDRQLVSRDRSPVEMQLLLGRWRGVCDAIAVITVDYRKENDI